MVHMLLYMIPLQITVIRLTVWLPALLSPEKWKVTI
nr:MAG TPA: hypothetical protein [Caudoviricetes sp.]